jgi:hypothetical protein
MQMDRRGEDIRMLYTCSKECIRTWKDLDVPYRKMHGKMKGRPYLLFPRCFLCLYIMALKCRKIHFEYKVSSLFVNRFFSAVSGNSAREYKHTNVCEHRKEQKSFLSSYYIIEFITVNGPLELPAKNQDSVAAHFVF